MFECVCAEAPLHINIASRVLMEGVAMLTRANRTSKAMIKVCEALPYLLVAAAVPFTT